MRGILRPLQIQKWYETLIPHNMITVKKWFFKLLKIKEVDNDYDNEVPLIEMWHLKISGQVT